MSKCSRPDVLSLTLVGLLSPEDESVASETVPCTMTAFTKNGKRGRAPGTCRRSCIVMRSESEHKQPPTTVLVWTPTVSLYSPRVASCGFATNCRHPRRSFYPHSALRDPRKDRRLGLSRQARRLTAKCACASADFSDIRHSIALTPKSRICKFLSVH